MASWSIIRPSDRLALKTREVWDREWQDVRDRGIAAHRLPLVPPAYDTELRAGRQQLGMTGSGLPPGERFDLSLTFEVNGERVSAVIPAIQCATDH